jgi:hypothetical protein
MIKKKADVCPDLTIRYDWGKVMGEYFVKRPLKLSAEYNIQAMKYLFDVWSWDSTTFLRQNTFIQRNNLGYIRNRILSQSRQPFF